MCVFAFQFRAPHQIHERGRVVGGGGERSKEPRLSRAALIPSTPGLPFSSLSDPPPHPHSPSSLPLFSLFFLFFSLKDKSDPSEMSRGMRAHIHFPALYFSPNLFPSLSGPFSPLRAPHPTLSSSLPHFFFFSFTLRLQICLEMSHPTTNHHI